MTSLIIFGLLILLMLTGMPISIDPTTSSKFLIGSARSGPVPRMGPCSGGQPAPVTSEHTPGLLTLTLTCSAPTARPTASATLAGSASGDGLSANRLLSVASAS